MRYICLLLLFSFLLPASLFADSGISCHCFQDRVYNPEQPGAADDYILATTRNSFISALFEIPKKQIVKARMSGTPGEDLWLAGYLAQRSGQTVAELLVARQGVTDWNTLLINLDGFPEILAPEVAAPVLARKSATVVVSALVELQVVKHLGLPAGEIKKLRSEDATDSQLILVALLARQSGVSAIKIFRQRRMQGLPWDVLLNQMGLSPKQLDPLMRKLLS